MNSFQCNKCGHQLQRPTQPYRCPQCGSQAVGLFRLIRGGTPPGQPGVPSPGVPPPKPGVPPPKPGIPPAPPVPTTPTQQTPPPGPQAPPPAQQAPLRPAPPPSTPPAAQPPEQPAPPGRSLDADQAQPTPAKTTKTRPTAPAEAKGPKPKETQRQAPKETKRRAPPKPQPPASSGSKPAATAATPPATPPAPKKSEAAAPRPPKSKPKPELRAEERPARPKQFAWAYPEEPPPSGEAKPLTNAPSVDSAGRVFLHLQGRLVALREQDARPQTCWEYVTGSHAPGPTTVAPDGSVRLHCSDGLLHCVNSEGKQVWPPAGVGEPLGYAAPIVDQQGNTYISAFDGGLIKVDTRGKVSRHAYFRSRQKFDAAGVVHQGVLYIGSEEGYVFAVRLDEPKGQNLWDHGSEQGHAGWYVRCWPAVTNDGNLVVAGRDERLHGFAPDGKPAWRTEMPGQMLGSPVIDPQGHVYIGLSQARRGQEPRGALACVDGNSHKIRWQYQAAGPVESTPVIGDDRVIYFGDNTGLVHAVDSRGKAQWTAQLEAAVRSAGTILAPERVAFGLDNETLVVLKCSSKGLAEGGWPKIGKTLGQCGLS